jgi:hypothetical protein
MYNMIFRVTVSTQITIDHLSNRSGPICDHDNQYSTCFFLAVTYREIACAALSLHPSAALRQASGIVSIFLRAIVKIVVVKHERREEIVTSRGGSGSEVLVGR